MKGILINIYAHNTHATTMTKKELNYNMPQQLISKIDDRRNKTKKKICHLPNKIAQCEKNTKRLQEIKEHFEGRL